MPQLLGPNGQPVHSSMFATAKPKGPKPILGEAFGDWSGADFRHQNLPGQGALQFDTNRLTLADFRLMRENYQINSSLSVINFMMHQMDWSVECEDKKIQAHVEANLRTIWTRLVRSMGQAFWAGFSPSVLQWENDEATNSVQLTKIKDLLPETCTVNWKTIEGPKTDPNSPPTKMKIYDGIKQVGAVKPIPVENSLWYPLLMENGDMYGRRLLKAAFQPWYFSQLMHLYANRYFERYGEPIPVGRAPYDESIEIKEGVEIPGRDLMAAQIQALRSRSVVVLPNDKTKSQGSGQDTYDYTLEYMESQMRGADFERYMARLDEEMSLALFTPLLLLRVGESGSYSLGTGHMQMFLWQLNALAGDWAEYINKYVLRPMAQINFPRNKKPVTIRFRELGKSQAETMRAIAVELLRNGAIKTDLDELGQAVGLHLEEVTVLSSVEDPPQVDTRTGRPDRKTIDKPDTKPTTEKVVQRIGQQVGRAFVNGTFGKTWTPSLGHARAVSDVFAAAGASDPAAAAALWATAAQDMIEETAGLGTVAWGDDPLKYMAAVEKGIEYIFDKQMENVA